MIDRTLGHFKITAHLGEGGMGTVYRAQDTRLGREVAIKLLPEAFAQDPDRLARFEREAQVVAGLNHPNICALYDVGNTLSEDGSTLHYLVMELVEGIDLTEQIANGPTPVKEASLIVKQIAAALEAAHENNIIHRDLKPANIKLTADGIVKVLDFGLAKAWDSPGDSGARSLSHSPTLTAQMTQAGMILGTAGYMSPEQAKGLEADRRADVWSFGVVLYELLTGKRLFVGDSVSETLAGVLRDPIDLDTLPGETPPAIHALLARCLNREPKLRLRDIGEARIAIAALESDSSSTTLLGLAMATPASGAESTTPRKRPWLAWSLTAIFALAAATMFVLWNTSPTPSLPLFHSSLVGSADMQLDAANGLAISPDGQYIAFVARESEGLSRLWVQRMAESEPRPLHGTDGASYPFWSPDSRNIGFFTNGNLKRIAVSGGPPQSLAPVSNPRGGTWGQDGTIVYTPDFRDGLFKIASGGGEPAPVTQLNIERGESNHRFPQFLPDGKHVLFLSQTAEGGSQKDDSRIEVANLDSGETAAVVAANSSMAYSPTGHLLFWREGTLMAQPFDERSRRVSGDAVPLAENVSYSGNEFATFSISNTGLMALQKGSGMGTPSRLTRRSRSGELIGTPSPPDNYREISLSHDGRRASFRARNAIWIYDLNRGTSSRITFDDGDHDSPIFSSDDTWVMYGTNRDHAHEGRRRPTSGMGEEELLFTREVAGVITDWSLDGRYVLTGPINPVTDLDLEVFDLESREFRSLIASPFPENGGRFSPDGRWVVYYSYEGGGQPQVFAVPFSGVGGKYQISTQGGIHPTWNPKGGEVFYLGVRGELMAVDVVGHDKLEIGTPRVLFNINHPINNESPFDVGPDGQTFLLNEQDDESSEAYVTLIQNWPELLKR